MRFCSARGGSGTTWFLTVSPVIATKVVPVAFFIKAFLKHLSQLSVNFSFIPPSGTTSHSPLPMQSFLLVIFTIPTGALTHSKTELGSAIFWGAFVVCGDLPI